MLETEHFRVIYQRELDSLAARVAAVAEKTYPEVSARAGLRNPFHLPIILNGYNDASNGFVSPLPFRMEIDASPIKGKVLNPRHEDWIAQVVPHELTHAAQAEIRGGVGVGDFIRIFSPDWARAINFGEPRGLTEGVAVSFESEGPGDLGRLNYSFTLMQVRAAAATNPWTMSQVFDPPGFTRPFDRYYTGGGVLYDYLADSVRADFFVESARFYNRWPFLGYGVALWQATGRAPWNLSRQFVRYSRRDLTSNQVQNRSSTRLSGSTSSSNSGSRTTDDGPRTTDVRGLSCRRPKWRDNQTLIAYCSGYNLDRGLYLFDVVSATRTLLARRVVTEDYYLSLDADRRDILFAEYRPLTFTTDAFVTRIRRVDLETGQATAIDGTNRLYAPLRLRDGSLLALRDEGQKTMLVHLDTTGATYFSPVGGGRILEIVERKNGDLILLMNRHGIQSLYTARIKGGRFDSLHPLLSSARGSIYDPAMLPDGTGILFSADPDGVPNVYRLDLHIGSVDRLTNATYGAFEPAVSPDGRYMAFVSYQHEQYQIAVQSMPRQGMPADSQFVPDARSPHAKAVAFSTSFVPPGGEVLHKGAYRPFPSFLRPRSLIPVFRARASKFGDHDRRLGPGIGASVSGTDPLQQWAYSLTGFFQENRMWGGMILQTGNHVLRPFISLSDRPRSSILTINGMRERVPYEERSVEIGGAIPVRLQAGTRNSSLAAGASAEYRSIRLLDSDAHPVTAFDDRITVNPFLSLGYGITANPRDLIPNAGLAVVSKAELDVKTENAVVPARSWRTDASVFVPVFSGTSRRFRILLGAFWRNRGSTADFDTFIPRGYDTEDAFLGSGTYLKAGAELVQPIAWVDRGIVLIPFSLQAIYLYGFTESTGRSLKWRGARSSAGAGMGFRILVAHHLGLDVRIGVARLLEESEWALTLR